MRFLSGLLAVLFTLIAGFSAGAALSLLVRKKVEIRPGTGKVSIFRPEVIGFAPYWLIGEASVAHETSVTTLAYFGLTVDSDGHILKLVNEMEEEPGYTTLRLPKLTGLLENARKNGQTTSLLVHAADDQMIAELLSQPEAHARNLLDDVIPVMKEGGYTDLNLDIESFTEASEAASQSFTAFVAAVSRGLKDSGSGTLTVEIAPRALIRPFITDPSAIVPYVDSLVLMTYDYHYSGSFVTGPVAPLGGAGVVYEYDVPSALSLALKVIPKDKLILGIPFYGYEWDTVSEKPGSPVVPGTGKTASNRRVTELLSDCPDCQTGYDATAQSPYVVLPGDNDGYFRQIFFEDSRSLTEKLDLARNLELKGVAVWALGYEDPRLLVPLNEYKNHRVITFF